MNCYSTLTASIVPIDMRGTRIFVLLEHYDPPFGVCFPAIRDHTVDYIRRSDTQSEITIKEGPCFPFTYLPRDACPRSSHPMRCDHINNIW